MRTGFFKTCVASDDGREQVTGFQMAGELLGLDGIGTEPHELGGSNQHANPQEHLLAALNACMMVGYVAQCSLRGITLQKLEIETQGEIDLRGSSGSIRRCRPATTA